MCLTQWCDMVTGSTLNVSSQYLQDDLQRCCSQSEKDSLGFRFVSDTSFGNTGFLPLQNQYEDLLIALFGKFYIGLELMIILQSL